MADANLSVWCLSVSASVTSSICRSVGLSGCRAVGPSACRPVCLSVCLSVCLPACRSVCLSIMTNKQLQPVRLSVCLSVCLFVCLSVCLFVCLSVSGQHNPTIFANSKAKANTIHATLTEQSSSQPPNQHMTRANLPTTKKPATAKATNGKTAL